MKIKSILALLLTISVASGAIYAGVNYIANAYIDIPKADDEGIETLANNGAGWTNHITFTGIHGGDTVNVEFQHRNPIETDIAAVIIYEIECTDGMVWAGGSYDGRIIDFFNDSLDGSISEKFEDGIVMTNIDNTEHTGNLNECIVKINDNTARIRPVSTYQVFSAGTIYYTTLKLRFTDDAWGNYKVRSYVSME